MLLRVPMEDVSISCNGINKVTRRKMSKNTKGDLTGQAKGIY